MDKFILVKCRVETDTDYSRVERKLSKALRKLSRREVISTCSIESINPEVFQKLEQLVKELTGPVKSAN